VVARPVVARQLAGQRRKLRARGELEKAAVRDLIHAPAERVIDLPLEPVPQPLHRGELETVVVAARAGGELRRRAESRIDWLQVRKRRKTSRADILVAIHLSQIGLIQ